MASPGLASFCCSYNTARNSSNGWHTIHSVRHTKLYNSICISTSAISIVGALYMILSQWCKTGRRYASVNSTGRQTLDTRARQRNILKWLAVADLFACLGVLVRSSVWLAGVIPEHRFKGKGNLDFQHLFCAISSGWIQYFYICTYFWTFNYALDVLLFAKERSSRLWLYHVLSWFVSAILCAEGLFSLYLPSLLRCELDIGHLLPHFLATYIPILMVLIVNPCIYYQAIKLFKSSMMSRMAVFTDQERHILSNLQSKFIQIMLVFFVCWSPNILNGFLLLFAKHVHPAFFKGLHFFMAVVNPLQAFLNAIVYRSWMPNMGVAARNPASFRPEALERSSETMTTLSDSERGPLLSFRR